MSILAHAIYGTKGFTAEKRELDRKIQFEIAEARRIQAQTDCSWSEALRISGKPAGDH